MTESELIEFYDSHEDDFLKFDDIPVERKLSFRPDLNAFLLLDKLVPGMRDMVAGAEHDAIYLDPDCDDLVNATEEQVLDLIRSGVIINDDGLLSMFV